MNNKDCNLSEKINEQKAQAKADKAAYDAVVDRRTVLMLAWAFTVKDVRFLLGGISQAFIYSLLNSGELKSFKMGDRRMVKREALEEYIVQQEAAQQEQVKASA